MSINKIYTWLKSAVFWTFLGTEKNQHWCYLYKVSKPIFFIIFVCVKFLMLIYKNTKCGLMWFKHGFSINSNSDFVMVKRYEKLKEGLWDYYSMFWVPPFPYQFITSSNPILPWFIIHRWSWAVLHHIKYAVTSAFVLWIATLYITWKQVCHCEVSFLLYSSHT